MLSTRQAYRPAFVARRARVGMASDGTSGGGPLGLSSMADRVVFASILTIPPALLGGFVFGPTGAIIGFSIGVVASLPVLFGG